MNAIWLKKPHNRQHQFWGSWIQHITDWFFGFDFFISYTHAEGLEYPTALADQLTQRKFRVFLDTRVYRVGENLKQATPRRVRMSRYLILVARPKALESEWVLREVQACVKAGHDPIVIDVNETYRNASNNSPIKAILGGNERLFQSETLDILGDKIDGEPSQETIERIVGSFEGARQETLRIRLLSATVVVLSVLLLLAGILAGTTYWQLNEARNNLALAFVRQSETALQDNHTNEALAFAAESLSNADTPAGRKILVDNPVYPRLPSLEFDVAVQTIDFFPDGQGLAIGLDNGEIWICGVFSGECEKLSATHDGWVDGLAVNLEGTRIASSNFGKELWLWNLDANPPTVQPLPLSTEETIDSNIFGPAFSPDGQYIAANLPNNEGMGLWNSKDGEFLKHVWLGEDQDFPGNFEEFSPIGKRIIFSQDKGFSQFELAEQNALPLWRHINTQIETISSGSITSAYAFNRDGSRLAVGTFEHSVLVFDTTSENSSGQLVREFIPALSGFQGFSNEVTDVGFSYDGKLLAAASKFGDVVVWEATDPWSWSQATVRTVLRVPGETTINAMKMSPLAPLIAVASSDGKVHLWDLSGGTDQRRIPLRHFLYQTEPESTTLAPLRTPGNTYATRVIFHPDNQSILAAGADGSIQQFNRKTGSPIKITPKNLDEFKTHGHNGRTRELAMTPDNSYMLTLGEAEVLSFVGENWKPSSKALLPDSLICSATSRSGRWLTMALLDNTLEIWDLAEYPHKIIAQFSVPKDGSCQDIAIADDGQTIALITQSNNKFQLQTWTIATQQFNTVIKPQEDKLWQVIFRPNGGLVVDNSSQLEFWQLTGSGYELKSSLDNAASPLAVSSDDLWLASKTGDNKISLYEIDSRQLLATFAGHTGQIDGLRFSPDGKTLASWSLDESVRLWNLKRVRQEQVELQTDINESTGWQVADGKLVPLVELDIPSKRQTAALNSLKAETDLILKIREQERGDRSWSQWWNEKYLEGAGELQALIEASDK